MITTQTILISKNERAYRLFINGVEWKRSEVLSYLRAAGKMIYTISTIENDEEIFSGYLMYNPRSEKEVRRTLYLAFNAKRLS